MEAFEWGDCDAIEVLQFALMDWGRNFRIAEIRTQYFRNKNLERYSYINMLGHAIINLFLLPVEYDRGTKHDKSMHFW
jgi:hypothetical protein